jgi:hypothetical protein
VLDALKGIQARKPPIWARLLRDCPPHSTERRALPDPGAMFFCTHYRLIRFVQLAAAYPATYASLSSPRRTMYAPLAFLAAEPVSRAAEHHAGAAPNAPGAALRIGAREGGHRHRE